MSYSSDPSKPDRVNNIGTAIMHCSKYTGELVDIDRGISALRSAVYLIPVGQPTLSTTLESHYVNIYRGLPLEVRFQSRAL
jgi:hypothetical protein